MNPRQAAHLKHLIERLGDTERAYVRSGYGLEGDTQLAILERDTAQSAVNEYIASLTKEPPREDKPIWRGPFG